MELFSKDFFFFRSKRGKPSVERASFQRGRLERQNNLFFSFFFLTWPPSNIFSSSDVQFQQKKKGEEESLPQMISMDNTVHPEYWVTGPRYGRFEESLGGRG